jgi:hypothetical protein
MHEVAMSEARQFEFMVLRYAPHAIKDEFVNIGVVLLEAGEGTAYVRVRMTSDWRRVLCIDADADIEFLDALGRDLQTRLADLQNRAYLMKAIEESFSGAVQLSSRRASLTADPDKELDTLEELYLRGRRPGSQHAISTRQQILRRMQDEFERAGVWKLVKHQIPVAEYTGAGDPLRIDCGYRPNGIMKMFHAVALMASADPATTLAFKYPRIVQGLKQKNIAAELTAIVDTLETTHSGVAFAVGVLQQAGINLALTEELPAIADRVRRELRA